MRREPGAGVMRVLEGRTEALSGTFNAQEVASTLWAYATMGQARERLRPPLQLPHHRYPGLPPHLRIHPKRV